MKIERTLDKYYYLTGDEKSKVGNATPVDSNLHWDYFEKKDAEVELLEPLTFKISTGKFSGTTGDYQMNSCGFHLLSDNLRSIFEKYLTDIDNPKWFPAKLFDLQHRVCKYSILYFFKKVDFLDHVNSTFVSGTDHPIKKRYDLTKIGKRLIYQPDKFGSNLCVHDIVRKEIKRSDCTGMYFYKIHTAGRLS